MLRCALCGHVTSRAYVVMVDQCPQCQVQPFPDDGSVADVELFELEPTC